MNKTATVTATGSAWVTIEVTMDHLELLPEHWQVGMDGETIHLSPEGVRFLQDDIGGEIARLSGMLYQVEVPYIDEVDIEVDLEVADDDSVV